MSRDLTKPETEPSLFLDPKPNLDLAWGDSEAMPEDTGDWGDNPTENGEMDEETAADSVLDSKDLPDHKQESKDSNEENFKSLAVEAEEIKEFKKWYSVNSVQQLVFSKEIKCPAYRSVFISVNKAQGGMPFLLQFKGLNLVRKRFRLPCAYFISYSLADFHTSHYVFGVIIDRMLLLIDPLARYTGAADKQLKTLQEEHKLEIVLSTTKIQRDPDSIVSCGPINVELMQYFQQLDPDTIRKNISQHRKKEAPKPDAELEYYSLDLDQAGLLPPTLKPLLTTDVEEYQRQIVTIRAKHAGLLAPLTEPKSADEQSLWLWFCQDFLDDSDSRAATARLARDFPKDERYKRLFNRWITKPIPQSQIDADELLAQALQAEEETEALAVVDEEEVVEEVKEKQQIFREPTPSPTERKERKQSDSDLETDDFDTGIIENDLWFLSIENLATGRLRYLASNQGYLWKSFSNINHLMRCLKLLPSDEQLSFIKDFINRSILEAAFQQLVATADPKNKFNLFIDFIDQELKISANPTHIIHLINALQNKQLLQPVMADYGLDNVLDKIERYKQNRPTLYRALLSTVVDCYHNQRERGGSYTSCFGPLFGVEKARKTSAANNLAKFIKSVMDHNHDEKKTDNHDEKEAESKSVSLDPNDSSALSSGQLGRIFKNLQQSAHLTTQNLRDRLATINNPQDLLAVMQGYKIDRATYLKEYFHGSLSKLFGGHSRTDKLRVNELMINCVRGNISLEQLNQNLLTFNLREVVQEGRLQLIYQKLLTINLQASVNASRMEL